MKNPLDVKENDELALDFALHLSQVFQSSLDRTYHSDTRVQLMLSSLNACLIMPGSLLHFF
jgi:hypothetical protein